MIAYFKPAFLIIALCSLSFTTMYDDACNIRNTAFKADEEIKMKVFYFLTNLVPAYGTTTKGYFSTTKLLWSKPKLTSSLTLKYFKL